MSLKTPPQKTLNKTLTIRKNSAHQGVLIQLSLAYTV